MIKINLGESKLNTIKSHHFKFIKNHIIKNYNKTTHNAEVNGFVNKYLLNERRLKQLIIGEPDELEAIINDVETNYPSIKCSTDIKFSKMYDDFSNYNIYKKTIDELNDLLRDIEKNSLTIISDRFYYRNKYKNKAPGDIKSNFDYTSVRHLFRIDDIVQEMINQVLILEAKKCNSEDLINTLQSTKIKIYEKDESIFENYYYFKLKDIDNILWGPYPFLLELGLTVCPYCNRNYIHTYYSKDGKARAQLDHFLSRTKYPYLSVSFYNLVPSCSVCNASLKWDKEFTFSTNINPYINGFEDEYKFTIKPIKDYKGDYDLKFLYGNSNKFSLDIIDNCRDIALSTKIKNNIEAFKLKELYGFHKDYIAEIIKKSIIYNPSRIEELQKLKDSHGKYLFSSKEEVINMLVSNYINKKDFGKRTLSKLTRDIAEELNLLDSINFK